MQGEEEHGVRNARHRARRGGGAACEEARSPSVVMNLDGGVQKLEAV